MVFLAGGFGGGTGTGASPVVAEISKNLGILTVAVVTKPFSFEGAFRKKIAEQGIRRLKEKVDTLVSIQNDKLLEILTPETAVISAFWICDDILRQAVQGISDLILLPGVINIDFADVKAIMKDSGTALFGIGRAKGDKRAEEAARLALNSPLLEMSCRGAKGVLFNVSGNRDIALSEIDTVAKLITQEINPQAKVIFGAVQDEKLRKGEIKVTVIATGF
jgi:cell division protein FtsZ